ncbi:MAG: hypothetical protein U5R48_01125 [Gammaproteobacteria bacterium]|nr:hypothetical protein [Gammaproteobacteria bacterium]
MPWWIERTLSLGQILLLGLMAYAVRLARDELARGDGTLLSGILEGSNTGFVRATPDLRVIDVDDPCRCAVVGDPTKRDVRGHPPDGLVARGPATDRGGDARLSRRGVGAASRPFSGPMQGPARAPHPCGDHGLRGTGRRAAADRRGVRRRLRHPPGRGPGPGQRAAAAFPSRAHAAGSGGARRRAADPGVEPGRGTDLRLRTARRRWA